MEKIQLMRELIELTSNYDKDNRYMAVSDINNELENDVQLSPDIETRLCDSILKRLDDTSNDVQSIAVKCLAILVKKVHEKQVMTICDRLCDLILSKQKSELRDIYSIGLKAAVADVPQAMGVQMSHKLSSRLTGGVNDDDESIKVECLDILSDLLKRFGNSMTMEHEGLASSLLAQLGSERQVVRKRATACLGQLACVVSDTLLHSIVVQLLDEIEKSQQTSEGVPNTHTFIQAVGTMSRMVGYRLGSQLNRIFPLVTSALKSPDDESMFNEQADELRENILHAVESLVMRCPREVKNHLDDAIILSSKFLVYDPNYNYDSDEDESGADSEEDDDYGYDDEDDYDDDDDTSWKVRRASIKVLKSIISTHCKGEPEFQIRMLKDCQKLLISRFKEREESVKIDIINCYKVLVHTVADSVKPTFRKKNQESCGHDEMQMEVDDIENESQTTLVKDQLPSAICATVPVLKRTERKGLKAKQEAISLLRELSLVSNLDEHLPVILPFMIDACAKSSSSKESALKLESLLFIREVLLRHNVSVTGPILKDVCPAILKCIGGDWYRVVAEGLRSIEALSKAMRPEILAEMDVEAQKFVSPCYEAILPRLKSNDIDQEIKESAILAMGTLFAYFGDMLIGELPTVIDAIRSRLSNQITRQAALKAIRTIASSPLRIDLQKNTTQLAEGLFHFLRQQSRSLKQETLLTLDALVLSSNGAIATELCAKILVDSAKLINDNDLYLSQLAIRLSVSIVQCRPESVLSLKKDVFPSVCSLLQSPLLQEGSTLDSILLLIKTIALLNHSDFTYDEIISKSMDPVENDEDAMDISADGEMEKKSLSRSALSSISKCVATACLNTPEVDKRKRTMTNIISEIEGMQTSIDDGSNTLRTLKFHTLLLSIGQIGRSLDLSKEIPSAYKTVTNALMHVETHDSASIEETLTIGAMALGNVTVGCMDLYLPKLFTALHTDGDTATERHQYVLLRAMLEIISSLSECEGDLSAQNVSHIQSMIPVLEENCEHKEEGVRNMVSECFGRLSLIDAQLILPRLTSMCNDQSSTLKRWTIANSLKYMSVGNLDTKTLKDHIEPFLKLTEDKDLRVRRTALLAINSLSHHHPSVILSYAPQIIRILYYEMSVKPELKRKVDLGPFKHTIDDGLPLRKAAFACISTFLDSMPQVVDVSEFLPHLVKGLEDVNDVQMSCHFILQQLCRWSPTMLLSNTSIILNPLALTINKQIKQKRTGTVDRTNDVIRSALRSLFALAAIPEAARDRSIQDFCAKVQSKPDIAEIIQSEHLLDKVRS